MCIRDRASTAGTAFTPAGEVTEIQDIVESMIQTLEVVKNDYTDGVDRNMMDLVLSPAQYGKLRTFLDTQSNPNVNTACLLYTSLPDRFDSGIEIRCAVLSKACLLYTSI